MTRRDHRARDPGQPRNPGQPPEQGRPPDRSRRRSRWDDQEWDDNPWDEHPWGDRDWSSSLWEQPPWARRTYQQDLYTGPHHREAGQESAFGGYQPEAATVEMRAVPDAVLFDRPADAPTRPTPPRAPAPPTRPGPAPAAAPPTRPPPTRPPSTQPPPAPEGPPPPSRRSSFLVAAGILLSRISGLVREVVMARYLGTSAAADAFRAALRIPNLLQNLLGEGVLSASFIPVYARLRSERNEQEAGRLAGATAGLLIALTGVLSVVGLLLAGPITMLITPGLPPGTHDLAVTLVRIMFPGIGFLVLSAWCLGVLNSHRRFFLSYVAPVLWNAAQIVALLAVALRSTDQDSMAVALAWGVLIGGLLQLAVQLGPVMALLGRLRLSLDTRSPAVRDVLRRFGPVLVSRGSVQLLAFFDLVLASWLVTGALAAMGYAQVLYLLPISLFGMSVAAAELPDLSQVKVFDPDTRRMFRRRLEGGMARIGFYVAPTATMFVVAGDVLVEVLFQRGNFTSQDARAVWLVLAAFALGLPAVTSSRLLINGLFALDEARTPARLAVLRVLLAAAIGLTFMFPFDRLFVTPDGTIGGWDVITDDPVGSFRPFPEDVRAEGGTPHLGIVALGLGTSIAAWVEYRMLSRALAVRIGRTRLAGRWLNPIAVACAAAALAAYGTISLLPDSLPSIIRAGAVFGPAGLTYLAVTSALGVPEAKALLGRAAVVGRASR